MIMFHLGNMDECMMELHSCNDSATCTDSVYDGSSFYGQPYLCQCMQGFIGDGYSCTGSPVVIPACYIFINAIFREQDRKSRILISVFSMPKFFELKKLLKIETEPHNSLFLYP